MRKFFIFAVISALIVSAAVLITSCTEKRMPSEVMIFTPTVTPTRTLVGTSTPTRTVTQTRTSTVTMTATPTATTPPNFYYHFDSDLEGFVFAGSVNATHTTDSTNDKILAGAGSAKLELNLSGGSQAEATLYVNSTPPNYMGKTIKVNVWVPASMAGQPYAVSVFVMTGMAWSWQNSWQTMDETWVVGDAWNEFTFTPVGVGEELIDAVGFQIQQNGAPDTTETVYVDEIAVE